MYMYRPVKQKFSCEVIPHKLQLHANQNYSNIMHAVTVSAIQVIWYFNRFMFICYKWNNNNNNNKFIDITQRKEKL